VDFYYRLWDYSSFTEPLSPAPQPYRMGSLSHMMGAISGAVIKGPYSSSDVSSLHSSGAQRVINYEQAFVLNSAEASVARAKGWLALTCSGEEIHEHYLQAPERQAEDNSVIQVWNALDADVLGEVRCGGRCRMRLGLR
jgi:hypothetical protein